MRPRPVPPELLASLLPHAIVASARVEVLAASAPRALFSIDVMGERIEILDEEVSDPSAIESVEIARILNAKGGRRFTAASMGANLISVGLGSGSKAGPYSDPAWQIDERFSGKISKRMRRWFHRNGVRCARKPGELPTAPDWAIRIRSRVYDDTIAIWAVGAAKSRRYRDAILALVDSGAHVDQIESFLRSIPRTIDHPSESK